MGHRIIIKKTHLKEFCIFEATAFPNVDPGYYYYTPATLSLIIIQKFLYQGCGESKFKNCYHASKQRYSSKSLYKSGGRNSLRIITRNIPDRQLNSRSCS